MCKKCNKCGQYMVNEGSFYVCEHCLKEIVNIKRQMWENQSKSTPAQEASRICDSCKEEVSVVNLILREGAMIYLCDECVSKRIETKIDAILIDIKEVSNE
jgi:hypothetical protein